MVHVKKLVLSAEIMGFKADIATIKISGYAKHKGELKDWTDLVCPKCREKPTYIPAKYECSCGEKINSWQRLLRVKKGTKTPVEIPRLTKVGEVVRAKIYTMPFDEFKNYVDAIDPNEPERFVTVDDDTSRINLFKLMVAHEIDKNVILVKFDDTQEQKIALLTTSASGRIVLRFIIPKNLVVLDESLRMDKTALKEKEIEEARMFLKQIPKASEEVLIVSDYRVQALDIVESSEEKVEQLAVILEKAKSKTKVATASKK